MKLTACLAILGATASLATAFVNPKEPWGQSVWKPGTQVTITWDDDNLAPTLKENPVVDIFLNTGGDQTNLRIATVATGVEVGKTNSYVYTVPNVNPPGKIYFLTFVQKGGAGMAWSTRFTITDASGSPGTIAPSAPVGSNPGAIGATATAPVFLNSPTGGAAVPTTSGAAATPSVTASATGAAAGTTSGAAASPSATSKPSGAVSLGASVLSAVAAVAAGAVALVL